MPRRMATFRVWLTTFVIVCGAPVRFPLSTVSAAGATPSERALIDRYCVTCHNQRLKTAGLALDELNTDDIGSAPDVWGEGSPQAAVAGR